MSSFLMNSGYSGVDPGKFPGSPSESEYSQSSYLGSHSDYYSHMQTAAQHYGYGASAAAAMSGYPNPRDPIPKDRNPRDSIPRDPIPGVFKAKVPVLSGAGISTIL